MKLKYLLVAVLVVAGGIALVQSGLLAKVTTMGSTKTKVTASFYPMAEFTRQVGGDRVEVTTLVKPGVEPHDYDPTPQDLAKLYSSTLFVYNGAGVEKWVSRVQDELKNNNVAEVQASNGIALKDASPSEEEPEAGAKDPHVWLDPVLAAQEVENIATGLAKIDPLNAGYYRDRAAAYKAKLTKLDTDYRLGLANCSRHEVVTSHDAFKYLAARYGFQALSITGLSPEEEPTPQQLAEVAQFAREHQVKYIFFETLVSPKLSETVATEIGAKTLVFNPLEGLTDEESKRGEDYISVQRANLNNLRVALDCK